VLGVVVYAYISELRRLRQEDDDFEVSLGYLKRPNLIKKKKKVDHRS
jgi:hypothetical protein